MQVVRGQKGVSFPERCHGCLLMCSECHNETQAPSIHHVRPSLTSGLDILCAPAGPKVGGWRDLCLS